LAQGPEDGRGQRPGRLLIKLIPHLRAEDSVRPSVQRLNWGDLPRLARPLRQAVLVVAGNDLIAQPLVAVNGWDVVGLDVQAQVLDVLQKRFGESRCRCSRLIPDPGSRAR